MNAAGAARQLLALVNDQLRVALEGVDHLQRLVAGLLDGVGHALGHTVGRDQPVAPARLLDGVEAPVLGLEDQQAMARVQHDEVGMAQLGADEHVEPEQVVVIELLLQALGEATLAGGHTGDAGVSGGEEDGRGGFDGDSLAIIALQSPCEVRLPHELGRNCAICPGVEFALERVLKP